MIERGLEVGLAHAEIFGLTPFQVLQTFRCRQRGTDRHAWLIGRMQHVDPKKFPSLDKFLGTEAAQKPLTGDDQVAFLKHRLMLSAAASNR